MSGGYSYMEANVIVNGSYMNTGGTGNYFTGTVDMYVSPDDPRIECEGMQPATIHYYTGQVIEPWESGWLQYEHRSNCTDTSHDPYILFHPTDEVKQAPNCYENPSVLFTQYAGIIGTAESTLGGMDPAFDLEQEVMRPQREPASYVLQAVDENDEGIGGVLFHINGQVYEADADGCVEFVGGPGVIAPLVITAADEEQPILRRISTYYIFPDRLNRIRATRSLELDFSLTGEDAPSGTLGEMNGFTVDLFGRQMDLLRQPMEVDVDLTGLIQMACSYNPDTGLYEVVFGSSPKEDEKGNPKEEAKLPLFEQVREAAEENRFPARMNKTWIRKKLAVEWDFGVVGYMELEWNGGRDFKVHESGFIIQGSGEARLNGYLPPPASLLYITGSLEGSLEVKGSAEVTVEDVAADALVQLSATVKPAVQLEVATGAGARAVDLYAEVALNGTLETAITFPFQSAEKDFTVNGSADVFGEARVLMFCSRISRTFLDVQL